MWFSTRYKIVIICEDLKMRNHLCTSKGWHSLKITWILQRKGGKSEAFRSRTEVPRGAPQDCVAGTKGGDDKIRFKLRTQTAKVVPVFQVWFFAWYNNFNCFSSCTDLSVYPLAVFLLAIRSIWTRNQESSNNRKSSSGKWSSNCCLEP